MSSEIESKLVLGIDPGLRVTGYGVISVTGLRVRLVEAGIIESGASALPLTLRLRNIYTGMESLVSETKPAAMAMEQLYSHYAHPRTAILMGHARGVLSLVAGQHGVEVFDYAATEIKSSLTGNGRANKEQIQRAIRATLGLTSTPEPADAADALAAALCHAVRLRQSR